MGWCLGRWTLVECNNAEDWQNCEEVTQKSYKTVTTFIRCREPFCRSQWPHHVINTGQKWRCCRGRCHPKELYLLSAGNHKKLWAFAKLLMTWEYSTSLLYIDWWYMYPCACEMLKRHRKLLSAIWSAKGSTSIISSLRNDPDQGQKYWKHRENIVNALVVPILWIEDSSVQCCHFCSRQECRKTQLINKKPKDAVRILKSLNSLNN